MIAEMYDAVLFDLFGTLVDDRGNAIAGARETLERLPSGRWAIVTSCPRGLAAALLENAGLPLPKVIITSDDVERGKPDPRCYALGAERLDFAPERCLVVEDSAQGVAAGVAAGMSVVAVARGRSLRFDRGDVHVIPSLQDLDIEAVEGGLRLRR
jgi:beta-phosphoglucomutase-like phosphatase (HAD superfamily)